MFFHTLRRFALFLIVSLAVLALAGCTGGDEPTVSFTSPENGATVSSPVHVEWAAENFTVEPAGEVRDGAGHLHVVVNADCLGPGQLVPSDETHLHFGKAQMEADVELPPGEHKLCLQAADGAHVTLDGEGLTDTITVTVE
jgi:hypothetical protein